MANALIDLIRRTFRPAGSPELAEYGPTRAAETRAVLEKMALVGPNDRPSLTKQVRCYDTSTPQYYPDDSTLADLDPATMCLNTVITVDWGPDGYKRQYRVTFDDQGPLQVFVDGRFKGGKVNASLVLVGSEADVVTGVEEFDPQNELGYRGPDEAGKNASLVREVVVATGVTDFYTALQDMDLADFPDGFPSPSTGEPGFWKKASPPTPAYQSYQVLSRENMLLTMGDEAVSEGKLYGVVAAQGLVLVEGLTRRHVSYEAWLVVDEARPVHGTYDLANDNFVEGVDVLAELAAKVPRVSTISVGGVVTTYASAQDAANFAPAGAPIVLRGPQGALELYASETIDAVTANFGANPVTVGFPPTPTAHVTRISGGTYGGRVVLVPQASAEANVYTLEDYTITGAGHLEIFLMNSGAYPGVPDVVNLTRVRGTKTTIGNNSPSLPLRQAMILLQGRTDFNHRQLIINERDCDLTNEVGPIYGGYVTRGSSINRLGTSRAVPGVGFALQAITSVDAGTNVAFTDAEIINDQRDTGNGGGPPPDLSNYYTRSQADARYLVLDGNGKVPAEKLPSTLVELNVVFPVAGAQTQDIYISQSRLVGTVSLSSQTSNMTNVSYKKNNATVSLPVAVGLSDKLTVAATAPATGGLIVLTVS